MRRLHGIWLSVADALGVRTPDVRRNERSIYVLRYSSHMRAHGAPKEVAIIFDRSINLTIMDQ
jgi:hypothetical protein